MTTHPRPISESEQPVFPCWLWHQSVGWQRLVYEPLSYSATHWLPDQPHAPQVVPEETANAVPSSSHSDYIIGDGGEKIPVAALEAVARRSIPTASPSVAGREEVMVGSGLVYRNAAPGTFGPSEWLDLLMACQDGRATCLRVMEFIERETTPKRAVADGGETIKQLAEAFLRWPLPESVCADLCATKQGLGRVGTNLLIYVEALAMMNELVAPLLERLEAELRAIQSKESLRLDELQAMQKAQAALRTLVAKKDGALRVVVAGLANYPNDMALGSGTLGDVRAGLALTPANVSDELAALTAQLTALEQQNAELRGEVEKKDVEIISLNKICDTLRQGASANGKREATLRGEVEQLQEALRREQKRDGNWLDEWGSCRTCGGEIPHGHSNGCDVFKMEQQISAMETALKDCHRVLVDSGQLEVHVPKSLVTAIETIRKTRA